LPHAGGTGVANFINRRQLTIEWGHCDPAGIVFNPRFFEYFDWSSWLLFEAALGMKKREITRKFGIVGFPLVSAGAKFMAPLRYGDVAEIASEITEFKRTSFAVRHTLSKNGKVSVEGDETRVWAGSNPKDPAKLNPIAIPSDVIKRFKV
jgi:4-hydroxybenzoyl-CoA thioesterase